MAEDPNQELNRKVAMAVASAAFAVTAAVLIIVALATHCGGPTKTVEMPTAPATPGTPAGDDPACPDGSPSGATRVDECPSGQTGQHKEVCAKGKWQDAVNTCAATPPGPGPGPAPACSKTTFADVQPILEGSCGSCHGAWTTFAGAQPVAAAMSQRIALPAADTQHMPPAGQPQPAADQVATLQKWAADGAVDGCTDNPPPPPGPTGPLTEDVVVGQMDADASNLSASDRAFTRYISLASAINEGITGTALQTWVDAVNKGLNSLNDQTQVLARAKVINQASGLLRFDLRDYAIGAAEIAAVEQGDVQINIVDNSSKGQVLQALLNTRKPFWDAQVFLDTAFRNGAVYNKLLNVPTTIQALQQQIGVNLAGDLATLPTNSGTGLPQVTMIGNVGQITLQKPRVILRTVQARSTTAYYLQTFDVLNQQNIVAVIVNGAIQQIDERNAFVAPLLPGTGAQAGNNVPASETLTQDASECIWQLPNGMQAYCLADAQGNILTQADPNIVQDNQSQIAPEGKNLHVITVGNTCTRCHNAGAIPMADAILSHTQGSDQFDANDVLLIQKLYQGATTNNKLFAQDQAAYNGALAQLGIKPGADPQAVVSDHYLGNWSAKQLAAFLWIGQDQLATCINGNAQVKSAIGSILTGTPLAFAQIEGSTLATLIQSCNLFRDQL